MFELFLSKREILSREYKFPAKDAWLIFRSCLSFLINLPLFIIFNPFLRKYCAINCFLGTRVYSLVVF